MKKSIRLIRKLGVMLGVSVTASAIIAASAFAEGQQLSVASINKTEAGVSGILKSDSLEKASVVYAQYDENNTLVNVVSQNVGFENGNGAFELNTAQSGAKNKFYVFNEMTNIMPLQNAVSISDKVVVITRKANGVVVSWDAVEGASKYSVYRDGACVGENIAETSFTDKYFSTIEQMRGETWYDVPEREEDPNIEHQYSVLTDNGIILNSASGTADTSKFKYITMDNVTNVKSIGGINAGSNGIMLIGKDDYTAKNIKQTGSYNRTVSTTTEGGFLKAGYSYTRNYANNLFERTYSTNYKGSGSLESGLLVSKYGYNAINDTIKNSSHRVALYAGRMVVGQYEKKHKTDSEGYLLNDAGERVTSLDEAAFTSEIDYYEKMPVVTNMLKQQQPYMCADLGDTEKKDYTILMNMRIAGHAASKTYTPRVTDEGFAPMPIKSSTVKVVGKDAGYAGATGADIYEDIAVAANQTYFNAEKYAKDCGGRFNTYIFDVNACFGKSTGAGVEGWMAANINDGKGGFNNYWFNLSLYGADTDDAAQYHSFAIVPRDEYIK